MPSSLCSNLQAVPHPLFTNLVALNHAESGVHELGFVSRRQAPPKMDARAPSKFRRRSRTPRGCRQLSFMEATPKGLIRAMGIPGLTLYHLKSHLQKYRLGRNQHLESSCDSKQEECEEDQRREEHFKIETSDETHTPINESLKIAQALQMQMEVQRKLHEQIEVQRHLQLRIEAQGKYLQSVLKKAHESLAECNSSVVGNDSQIVSTVDSGCLGSLILEEAGATSKAVKDAEKISIRGTVSSMESSLTSSESSGRNEETIALPLDDIEYNQAVSRRKRSGNAVSDANCCVEQPPNKRSETNDDISEDRKLRGCGVIDLNRRYQNGTGEWGPQEAIDL